ncbi:hypothetical protein ABPG72_002954, partial [Tetrahymena utriculariae]
MTEESQIKQRLIINDFELRKSKVNQRQINNTPLQIDNHQSYQKPLNLFLVCTGQDDLNGQLEPLNVYTQPIQPKTHYQFNGQTYYTYFDEGSYRSMG